MELEDCSKLKYIKINKSIKWTDFLKVVFKSNFLEVSSNNFDTFFACYKLVKRASMSISDGIKNPNLGFNE